LKCSCGKKEERFPLCEKIREIEKIDARENCFFFHKYMKKIVLKD